MPKKNTKYSDVKERAIDIFENAGDKIEDVKDKTENFVKNNPMTSMVIAAAIGAAIALGVGAMLKSRKKTFFDNFRDYLHF